jgi:hypothetical protein
LRTRIGNIGQHARRSQEHIVLNGNAAVDRNIVLNLYAITENSVGRNQDVLSERAIFSYYRSRTDVSKVPNACALTYHCALIDDSGGVNFSG